MIRTRILITDIDHGARALNTPVSLMFLSRESHVTPLRSYMYVRLITDRNITLTEITDSNNHLILKAHNTVKVSETTRGHLPCLFKCRIFEIKGGNMRIIDEKLPISLKNECVRAPA